MKEKNGANKVGINPWEGKNHPRGAAGKPSWNSGLTKDTDARVAKNGNKVSDYYAKAGGSFTGKKHSKETRRKMSKQKAALYATGWEPICGRCKKYEYISPIAGTIKVDGTWELKVAYYLDSLGVSWVRNKTRFQYVRPDGRTATYQPDFYVETWKSYLEIKGYETELDRAKWSQFNEPLLVWKKKEIQNLGNVSTGC